MNRYIALALAAFTLSLASCANCCKSKKECSSCDTKKECVSCTSGKTKCATCPTCTAGKTECPACSTKKK